MPQSSLIPTVIALSRFFSLHFPHVLWYPDWYLGNPYHFLIGPVIPFVLFVVSHIIPVSLTTLYGGIIFASFFIGAYGVYVFLGSWGISKQKRLWAVTIYSILPFGMFLLHYQNGLHHIAFSCFPYVLGLYRAFLKNNRRFFSVVLAFSVGILLLIDVSMLLPLIIGFVSVYISAGEKKDKDEKIVKSVIIIFLGIFLSSIWYTPFFWWVLLTSPSFGGIPLVKVFFTLLNSLLQIFPFVLAVLIARLRKQSVHGIYGFAFLFTSSFLVLTGARFIGDPKFVLDWTGYLLELQFGTAILLITFITLFFNKRHANLYKLFYLIICICFASSMFLFFHAFLPKKDYAFYDKITKWTKEYVSPDERIFLSGSPVFWINENQNILQVRGGNDAVSVHPFWAHAAYQIREGIDPDLTKEWLLALGARYILVHERNSDELFHDFKNTKKFQDFSLVTGDLQDKLYKVNAATIARIADKRILMSPKPNNGADTQALHAYTSAIKQPVGVSMSSDAIQIQANMQGDDVISLAITASPTLHLQNSLGTLVADVLGNTVIIPKKNGPQTFVLTYKRDFFIDVLLPILLSSVTLAILLFYSHLSPLFRKRFPSFNIGLTDSEEY